MKVLNVDMTLAVVEGGGTTERTFQMSRTLARHHVDCAILTTDFGITEDRRRALKGVEIIALPCLIRRFFIPRLSVKKIAAVVENADVIHLMGHWTIINVIVYFFASRRNKPYMICPAGSLLIYGRSKILKRIYNLVIGKKILKNAQKVIAITEDEISQIKEYGISDDRIALIPNGIDPENYREKDDDGFREKYGLGDHPLILFLGGLRAIKGPDLLLDAFINIYRDLKEHHLVFIGHDRGSLTELQQTVERQNVADRVHFIGYVDGPWKSKAYHAAELLVIPSRHEAMSIVILEAGITATPVLVTDRCGLNEIPQIGGGMVVSASVEALESGLRKMLTAPEQLEDMGAKLYRHVTQNLVWDVVITKYIELSREILDVEK